MAGLSISQAWDGTKARIAADGKLMMAVAGGLIAVPALITGVISPSSATAQPGLGAGIVMLLASLLAIIGQIAIIRLAVGTSVSVGEAIGHGARRMPMYLLAAILIVCGLVVAAIPLVAVLAAMGIPLTGEGAAREPVAVLLAFLYLALVIFVAVRMLLTSPVASEENVGPIAIIKRSWEMTRGNWWRLFGFVLMFVVGVLVAVTAIGIAVGSVAVIAFGPIEPMSVSALLVSLVEAVVQAVITVVLAVMLARIYLQLAGDEVDTVSVPSSGT